MFGLIPLSFAAPAALAALVLLAALYIFLRVTPPRPRAETFPPLRLLLALANKETLVCAGAPVVKAVRKYGATLLPLDSEHNAIHQCMRAGTRAEVEQVWLTASGGPFRTLPLAEFTPEKELAIAALVQEAARKAYLQLGHSGTARGFVA